MKDKYLIKNSTVSQREQAMKASLVYTTLDGPKPTPEAMALGERYIAGEIELDEAIELTIARYKKEPSHG